MSVRIGIIGAASLSANRMLGLLLEHPGVEVAYLASGSEAGKPLHASHPHLRGVSPLRFEPADLPEREAACDVLFLTRPAGMAFTVAARLLALGKKVIDLSADFRLERATDYLAVYGDEVSQPPRAEALQPLLDRAVYGLAEINASAIRDAQLVANPGCYATSVILSLAPLAARRLLPALVAADSFSGISGAGRGLKNSSLFINVNENITAYKTGTHRHVPEIEQALGKLAGTAPRVFFNPHVAPLDYGILTNVFLPTRPEWTVESVLGLYEDYYRPHRFVRVLDPGRLPAPKDVQDTNFCDLGIHLDVRTGWLRISAALDNTIKGAGGQAIQCFNLMMGFEPGAGLPYGRSAADRLR